MFVPRRMTGRCTTGAERDGGTVYHAVSDHGNSGGSYIPAACGATPGHRHGNGWSYFIGTEVTCNRCKKRIDKIHSDALQSWSFLREAEDASKYSKDKGLIMSIPPNIQKKDSPITVGELKSILAHYPDGAEVWLGTRDGRSNEARSVFPLTAGCDYEFSHHIIISPSEDDKMPRSKVPDWSL